MHSACASHDGAGEVSADRNRDRGRIGKGPVGIERHAGTGVRVQGAKLPIRVVAPAPDASVAQQVAGCFSTRGDRIGDSAGIGVGIHDGHRGWGLRWQRPRANHAAKAIIALEKQLPCLQEPLAFEGKQLAFQDNEVHGQGKQVAFLGKQLPWQDKQLPLLDKQLAFEGKQLPFQDNEVHRQGSQAALPGKQLHGRDKLLACLASELRCQGKQLALLDNGLAFLARKAAPNPMSSRTK
jgi:hypothetical protein